MTSPSNATNNEGRTDVAARRDKVLSPSYRLFYDEPLHVVRGEGVYLYDESGKRYLDCYNNVPSVGHCHPHVVDALTTQAKRLNTNTRYLHETVVTYAERLTATLPEELSSCIFVCTGTEANGLAYQIARSVTGRSGVVAVEGCYHGNSIEVSDFSPYGPRATSLPPHIRSIPVPDLYRSASGVTEEDAGQTFAGQASGAIEELAASPHGFAMGITDNIFDAAGIFTAPKGYLAELYGQIRAAGGLAVADEVQSGLCRLGDNFWAFMDSDVVPDIVTMGKPMGDGHPLAVVVAKRWIMDEFAKSTSYFNTFGGNPVSAAVGNAVLDVVEGDNLLSNVGEVGRHLTSGLKSLQKRHNVIGDVRGKGFFIGIDIVSDQALKTPAPELANRIVNGLRQRAVLVTATGLHDNVVKVRPPLVFSQQNADSFLESLDAVLTADL